MLDKLKYTLQNLKQLRITKIACYTQNSEKVTKQKYKKIQLSQKKTGKEKERMDKWKINKQSESLKHNHINNHIKRKWPKYPN